MARLFASIANSAPDLAIDLGTANTVVYARGAGIIFSEPSVVAVDSDSGQVHAVGAEAKRMIGRTPASISAMLPLRHGVIADFEVTEQMLRSFIRKAHKDRFSHPRVVMCVPSGVTDVEKRAVEEACLSAGARQVRLIEEPLAAAIGAGLAIAEPRGNLVVDVGGGTTEVALISLGGIVVSKSLRIGGYDLDDAIAGHVRRQHQIAVGPQRAEDLKLRLGSAMPLDSELEADVKGRNIVTGLPKSLTLGSDEVRTALEEPLRAIIDVVKEALEESPPELAGDISDQGVMLAGGGSLLRAFDQRLRSETQMPVQIADSPLTCVAVGAGQSLEEYGSLPPGRARRRKSSSRSRRATLPAGFR
jgi:rod shape-determining protein MreB